MKKTKRKITDRKKTLKKPTAITKNTTFLELMQKYPETAEILLNSGLHCVGCSAASFETIEQGALLHGLDPDKIIKDINKKIKNKK